MRAKLKNSKDMVVKTSLENAYNSLCELESYTYLNSPVKNVDEKVIELTKQLSQVSGVPKVALTKDHINLLRCFDGGLLFGTLVFSLDSFHGDENDYDLYSINKMLYSRNELPHQLIAIAMLNYGDYIVATADASNELIGIWSMDEKRISGQWNTIGEWLEEECDIAKKLISENALEICED